MTLRKMITQSIFGTGAWIFIIGGFFEVHLTGTDLGYRVLCNRHRYRQSPVL